MKQYYSTREPWTTLSETPEAQESHIKLFMDVNMNMYEILLLLFTVTGDRAPKRFQRK
jgi:hypothetical protein